VLNQTYTDFEYIIVDNGCTDGSSKILQDYAARDKRIHLIRYEENQRGFWTGLVKERATGEYLTILDSDDWWEPDYLERLVAVAEKTEADVICTGTKMHVVSTGTESLRAVMQRLDIPAGQYAELLPYYHAFLRATWAKLFRMSVFRKAKIPNYRALGLTYGGDTLSSFAVLREADRLVVDDSILHHYRIHDKSVSYQYTPRRFDSDVYLYNDAIDFLSAYGPVSEQNREFLAAVYANAVNDTVKVIRGASIPKEDKLREYGRIADHPITKESFSHNLQEVREGERQLLLGAISCHDAPNAAEELPAVLSALVPKCAAAFSPERIPLLAVKPELAEPLSRDDAEAVLSILLTMLRNNEQSKRFDLCAMIRALSADKPLLADCCEKKFLRRHGDIYLAVWRGQYAQALDKMTGLLLDGEKTDETFLSLYLSLAALQNQPEAFVFGKVRLAQLLLRKGEKKACADILGELAEMGVEENEEIAAMKAALEK
jgi:glycosyltransferase involved in cell wall biosynthesis